ncbi:ATP-binding protein [Rhodococcus tukisamuensis]|uniref:histidine kinase n=1 Tax=Rhodococcus tukisamuensis TaxID=168276 RepID=A0A1G7DUW7_9NOCA|nr:ATP-binding protein [Rhodococcus tukisamuensis]SDE55289.1 Signal transduction histidine kinase [Rhodococcus tukisamuensis]
MKTQSPPVNRPWNLEGWGLRWKVTAVVALPITAAMVLGGLRVQDQLSTAAHFSEAATRTSIVAPLLDMDVATGFLIANYLSRQGSPTDDAAQVSRTIEAMREAVADPEMDPDLVASVDRVIGDTEALRGDMTKLSLDDLGARTAAIQSDAAKTVIEAIAPIGDETILNEGTRLIDAWAAQRRLFDQTLAIIKRYQDPNITDGELAAGIGAELAMIDILARYFPEDDPNLAALRQAVNTRSELMLNTPAGTPPKLEMHQTMLDSQSIYTPLIKSSTAKIIDLVAAKASETRSAAVQAAVVVLATLLATILLGLLVARSLIRPINRLRRGAIKVADEDLPNALERIKVGDTSAVTDFEPIPVHTTEEIGTLARAVDDMHGQALKLAGEQAQLRLQIGDMFETLARRSKSLVDQQLGLIENLEFEEKDPRRLESLFRLDHLAARMRRNGENLLILSGTRTRRGHSEPVQVGDVLRAAMSEVEDYQRVEVGNTPQGAIAGAVATDIVHLLAELLDNSLRASPPESKVTFNFARAVDGGLLLEISDRGIGIQPAELAKINERLASGGEVSAETARHMGLYVISELAAQHGLTVRMRPTFDTMRNQGVTTSVHIPHTVMVSPLALAMTGPQASVDAYGEEPAPRPRPAAPMAQVPQPQTQALQTQAPQSQVPESQVPETRSGPVVPVTVTLGPGPLTLAPGTEVPSAQPPAAQPPAAQPPAAQPPAAEPPAAEPPAAEPPAAEPPAAEQPGLPQRTPGVAAGFTEGAPERPDGPRPPERTPDRPAALPQRAPGPTAAPPQRVPESTVALPRRTPGATPGLPPRSDLVAGPVTPAATPDPVVGPSPVTGPDNDDPARARRHRYRLNSEKTASFFMARPRVEEPPALLSTETTPIFMGMVSDWLTDPISAEGNRAWKSAADVGWDAANRAAGPRGESRTASGLPQRRPGHRLVPGGVDGADKINTPPRLRDPDAIREKLSRHQQGIREGRAAGQAERNSI